MGTAIAAELKPTIGRIAFWMALTGFVVARLVFVITAWELYRATPSPLLDYKDGGYTPWAGGLAGLAMAILRGWRQPPLRRALMGGLLSAAGALLAGTALVGMRDAPALPPLTLTALDGTAVELQALTLGPARGRQPLGDLVCALSRRDARTRRRAVAGERGSLHLRQPG